MSTTDEQDRVLRGPRTALQRARRDQATWADLAYCDVQGTDEGAVTDRNRATRFAVLWALQYDRRPQDLPLLCFLLQQQTTYYREAVPWGMASDLTLAGFLVAEHRQVDDLWLHWDAKNISFDTALGYHLYHLLTAGIAASTEAVQASSHPDRDRILGDITSARHTDTAVGEWLDQQRARFPADPADEGLKAWAHHAARLGEREASRLFMTEWAASEPRTGDTLNALQFHLAHLGYLTEAVDVQKEAVALNDSWSGAKGSKLLTLARLQRRTDDFAGAWQTLQEAQHGLPPDKRGIEQGKWRHFVKECFLLVPNAPDTSTAQRLLAASEQDLQGIPRLWMDGVLDAAIAAAEYIGDPQALHRYGELQQVAARERAQEVGRATRPSPSGPATS
ncbi:hypothetical protein KUF83_38790 [Streptomyces sp. BV286]|nr:hypothetical protein [Streptomyces sp. BV286]